MSSFPLENEGNSFSPHPISFRLVQWDEEVDHDENSESFTHNRLRTVHQS